MEREAFTRFILKRKILRVLRETKTTSFAPALGITPKCANFTKHPLVKNTEVFFHFGRKNWDEFTLFFKYARIPIIKRAFMEDVIVPVDQNIPTYQGGYIGMTS